MKKKTSVKKVNFRITKPFSQLKSISALILPGIETVIGNNLSFELFYHIGEVLSSKVFTKARATAFTFLERSSIIRDMEIEKLKEEITKIKEPRRTGYGNIRHKLEDIIIIGLCTV